MTTRLLYEEKVCKPYLLFLPCHFRIHENCVEAYFWPYKHVTQISNIKEVRVVERLPWYVGWGLRVNPFKRKLYFAVHHRKGVEILQKEGMWKSVVLTPKEPEKFTLILKDLMRS
jgi:hypothetical protein